jgi:hypothetical protein
MKNRSTESFNTKWSLHLEAGHYGMAISSPVVLEEADKLFSEWSEDYPGFTYAQIKLKWGRVCLYVEGIPAAEAAIGEEKLQRAYTSETTQRV